jgi:hypothetical protein
VNPLCFGDSPGRALELTAAGQHLHLAGCASSQAIHTDLFELAFLQNTIVHHEAVVPFH